MVGVVDPIDGLLTGVTREYRCTLRGGGACVVEKLIGRFSGMAGDTAVPADGFKAGKTPPLPSGTPESSRPEREGGRGERYMYLTLMIKNNPSQDCVYIYLCTL